MIKSGKNTFSDKSHSQSFGSRDEDGEFVGVDKEVYDTDPTSTGWEYEQRRPQNYRAHSRNQPTKEYRGGYRDEENSYETDRQAEPTRRGHYNSRGNTYNRDESNYAATSRPSNHRGGQYTGSQTIGRGWLGDEENFPQTNRRSREKGPRSN